ncbi:hypothetical protein [Polyangium sp. 15x6]|uniref:hypothetical protein n=1 Tax=Polyangium sp. 15x6 TaxID=3042687 RepID=UPI00249CBF13|nr:hypothetical protein [Polyangium sp. 15x6]MDI3291011.1 hypothetical protein [Polyangium sp. 15x6]
MAIGPHAAKPPHPATVTQPQMAIGPHAAKPPHPATVAQPKLAIGPHAAKPPHPATVAQPQMAIGPHAAKPPHPATIVQPKVAIGPHAAKLPHPATVVQRASTSTLSTNMVTWNARAQTHFGTTAAFTGLDFVNFVLGYGTAGRSYALKIIATLRAAGELFPGPGRNYSDTMMLSFDRNNPQISAAPSRTGGTWSRREASGFINPAHTAMSVRPLFLGAAVSPVDTTRQQADWLFSPSRRFYTYTPTHTQAPLIVTGHSNTVMGHNPDAVDRWNSYGHKQTRAQNRAENSQASFYHGLEDRGRSNASGGATTARYLSPNASLGSHAEHYDTTDPNFDSRVPWTTY